MQAYDYANQQLFLDMFSGYPGQPDWISSAQIPDLGEWKTEIIQNIEPWRIMLLEEISMGLQEIHLL